VTHGIAVAFETPTAAKLVIVLPPAVIVRNTAVPMSDAKTVLIASAPTKGTDVLEFACSVCWSVESGDFYDRKDD
jgi:hypothetical protein